ncbi:MAG: hypothetical protein FVQ81_07860 [Candidatus Glassbacteria bacterium]|nr:hypothetical protein [Candidatus Glassbacteria bacterium]
MSLGKTNRIRFIGESVAESLALVLSGEVSRLVAREKALRSISPDFTRGTGENVLRLPRENEALNPWLSRERELGWNP